MGMIFKHIFQITIQFKSSHAMVRFSVQRLNNSCVDIRIRGESRIMPTLESDNTKQTDPPLLVTIKQLFQRKIY